MRPRNMITADDRQAVENFLTVNSPLSGYLAGQPRGGAAVQRLEELWATKYGRRYAIACNSATSGLLAACEAHGIRGDLLIDTVAVPALSMSATAAVPRYCGADLHFTDVDEYGCQTGPIAEMPRIATTLFGCPVLGQPLILDNAQGIGAKVGEHYAEQFAQISVTSFNVHKQLNCGEGGMITTDDIYLADTMRAFINHGECAKLEEWPEHGRGLVGPVSSGLNLRMTEISAVLALSQMRRIDDTIAHLEGVALMLDNYMPSAFTPLGVRPGCTSAHYCYAFKAGDDLTERNMRLSAIQAEAVPAIPMYRPLYTLPAFARYARECPNAEAMADQYIVLELCAWEYENYPDAIARALEKAAKL